MPDNNTLTIAKARKLLGIPPKGSFTAELLQSAWRESAKAAHPDAGGTDEQIIQVNAARDLLQPLAVESAPEPKAKTTRKPKPAKSEAVLTISPDGHLFGERDQYLGNCRTVAAAIAYCAASGWSCRQTHELTDGQRRVLEASHA